MGVDWVSSLLEGRWSKEGGEKCMRAWCLHNLSLCEKNMPVDMDFER